MEFLAEVDWTNMGMLFATILLAFLTGAYVSLTKKLVKSQVEPCVITFVHHDDTRPTILQLVIRNIGSAMARDINFDLSEEIPERAFGLDPKTAKVPKTMTEGPLIDGIPALAPNEDRRIDWGQYAGLSKALGGKAISVKAAYLGDGKKLLSSECVLEIKSFLGTNASEYDPYKKIVEQLKRLGDDLHGLSTGNKLLKVRIEKELENSDE